MCRGGVYIFVLRVVLTNQWFNNVVSKWADVGLNNVDSKQARVIYECCSVQVVSVTYFTVLA